MTIVHNTPTLAHCRFGGNLVSKKLNAKPKRSINPMVVLDYRCYSPGHKIGTNYPPELSQVGWVL